MKLGLFDGNTLHGHNESVFSNFSFHSKFSLKNTTKLNHTDRAAAAGRRS
jgi:hypothetical protein